jgi:hypothetical protein
VANALISQVNTQTMRIKSITHNKQHCYVFSKYLLHTLAGFEPGSSVPVVCTMPPGQSFNSLTYVAIVAANFVLTFISQIYSDECDSFLNFHPIPWRDSIPRPIDPVSSVAGRDDTTRHAVREQCFKEG